MATAGADFGNFAAEGKPKLRATHDSRRNAAIQPVRVARKDSLPAIPLWDLRSQNLILAVTGIRQCNDICSRKLKLFSF